MVEPTEGETLDRTREAAESAAGLERGGLPLEARRRLAQETGERPLFATDLSVDEFLLARDLGYEAAGLVLGSSIYHIGWQFINTYGLGELGTVTRAHLQARELAMGRLQQEATTLGAHGVVGVRLTTRDYDWGPGLLEFTAIGTAVRLRGVRAPAHPFLSDLSGEDFWALLRAGYVPRGLAMGFSAFLSSAIQRPNVFNRGNWEITAYSQAVYQARHHALQRMHADLDRLGADGVVGVKVETHFQHYEYERGSGSHWHQLRVDFFALGTAIGPGPQQAPIPRPPPVLNMTGLRPVRRRLAGAELWHSQPILGGPDDEQ